MNGRRHIIQHCKPGEHFHQLSLLSGQITLEQDSIFRELVKEPIVEELRELVFNQLDFFPAIFHQLDFIRFYSDVGLGGHIRATNMVRNSHSCCCLGEG